MPDDSVILSDIMENIREKVIELVESNDFISACEIIALYPPAFAAEIIEYLDGDDKIQIFFRLPVEYSADVLIELTEASAREIIANIYDGTLTEILKNMQTDDAVDILGIVNQEQAARVLIDLPDSLKELFEHPEDSAGGIMEAEFLSFSGELTVSAAVLKLKQYAERIDEIFQLYIVDKEKHLKGILPIQKLIIADKRDKLCDIADPVEHVARVDQDQEEVAQLFRRNDLVSMPVIDDREHIVGQITFDDIVDVVDDEATEDSFRMAGLGGEEYVPSSFHQVKDRLPWLAVSLGAEIVSGTVLQHFSDTIRMIVILASFIPLIMAMGGNVGVQSATVIIRRLALGHLEGTNRRRIIIQEILAGLMLGVIFGICLVIVGYFWGDVYAGIVAGVSIFSAMTVSTLVGCFFPLLLERFGMDPAFATGPFITAFNDVIGLFIYLLIATQLLVNL